MGYVHAATCIGILFFSYTGCTDDFVKFEAQLSYGGEKIDQRTEAQCIELCRARPACRAVDHTQADICFVHDGYDYENTIATNKPKVDQFQRECPGEE